MEGGFLSSSYYYCESSLRLQCNEEFVAVVGSAGVFCGSSIMLQVSGVSSLLIITAPVVMVAAALCHRQEVVVAGSGEWWHGGGGDGDGEDAGDGGEVDEVDYGRCKLW